MYFGLADFTFALVWVESTQAIRDDERSRLGSRILLLASTWLIWTVACSDLFYDLPVQLINS